MTYQTIYLHSDNEQALLDALAEQLGTDEEGNVLTASHGHCLDYPVALYRPTGNTLTDEDGNEHPEMEPVPGYHANLRIKRHEVVDALTPFTVTPATPQRVFA